MDNWTLKKSSTKSDDRVLGSGNGEATWRDVGALWSGGLLRSSGPTHSSISLWFRFYDTGSIGGISGGCDVKAGRNRGGATNCRSYGISGAIVCIIPTKVCTCFASLRNASGETTEGTEVSPGGESLGH